MLGRSDGTLNPHGIRFGSAELYNIVDMYPEIEDSLVVGQKQGDGDERVLMFIKMKANPIGSDGGSSSSNSNGPFSPDLVLRLKTQIRQQLSPRHVPAHILAISDIPYTVNGKKVEIAAKTLVSQLYKVARESGSEVACLTVKLDPKTVSTLANPDSLDLFYQFPEILT